jgi:acyl-CoA synthetase (AMP-forming)/AMP-acid ligase II
VLIQVADDSGHDLLPGAVDYESIIAATQPTAGSVEPSGDDLYIIYTGGTTGMPKGVLWRRHDIFLAAMGGRPFGSDSALTSYAELADRARQAVGAVSLLMLPPFIHGAAQWGAFHAITMGGRIVIPDDVHRLNAHQLLQLAQREKVLSIPVVGDAMARPLVEALEQRQYDLTSLAAMSNGGAPLSPSMRDRIMAALPHVSIIDGVGASESGMQLNTFSAPVGPTAAPPAKTTVSATAAPVAASAVLLCRDAWGARPARAGGRTHIITRMTLHHSAVVLSDNRNSISRLRQHQRYHQDQLGWIDIAYHIGVDRDGNLYELPDTAIAGDTDTKYDPTGHFLVVCEGNFEEEAVSEAQLQGTAHAFAWAAQSFGITSSTLAGHRQRQPWNRLSRSQPLRPPDLGRPQAPYRRAACRRTGHPQSHLRTRRRRHRHRY